MASALHQRFGVAFSGPLLANILYGVANPSKSAIAALPAIARDRELKAVFQRQMLAMRIITELWIVGVFREVSDAIPYGVPAFAKIKSPSGNIDPPPIMALKEILTSDLVNFTPVTVVFMLHKYYGKDLFESTNGFHDTDRTPLVPVQIIIRLKRVLGSYASSFDRRARFLSRELLTMQRLNEKRFLKFGSVKEEHEVAYKTLYEESSVLLSNCQQLFKILGLHMAEIVLRKESDFDDDIDEAKIGGDAWNDKNEKDFYENIVSLVTQDPNDDDVSDISDDEEEDERLLQTFEKMADEKETISNKSVGDDKQEEFVHAAKEKFSSQGYSGDVKSTPETIAEIEEIIQILSHNPSKETVDECSVRFKEVNNKKSRSLVLEFLTKLSPRDQHKVRYYSRFIATINPIAPGIVDGVLDYLWDFFKYVRRKKISGLYATRMYVSKYLSEMIKFGIVPKKLVFHTFHSLLIWIDKYNVETLCSLLEGCGKYLYFKSNTHKLMSKYMDMIEAKRSSFKLGVDERMLITYALHYVRPPPPVAAVPVKDRPIIERYIAKLIYIDLKPSTKDEILATLYKLNWDDKDTYYALRKVFYKIWKVEQENISLMADMLADIKKYYYSFATMTVDSLVEEIRRGLELSGFKNNQIRLAQAIYLGELCKRRIVDHSLVMTTLYQVLTFGYPGNMPSPEGCPLDPSTELFRIRLACTILDTAGPYLNYVDKHLPTRGIGREIDLFLAFFQYYIRLKRSVSMDVEFAVKDTFKRIRPRFPIYETIEGASRGLECVMSGLPPQPETVDVVYESKPGTETQPDDSLSDDNHSNEDHMGYYSQDIGRNATFRMPKYQRSEEQEKERQKRYKEKQQLLAARADAMAEDEIEQELQQLIMERSEVNKNRSSGVRKPFDAPIPDTSSLKPGKPDRNYVPPKAGHVKYALLTKSGSNNHSSSSGGSGNVSYKSLELPSTATFVAAVAKEREQREKEKERIKNIIMKYEYLDEENDNTDEREIVPFEQLVVTTKKKK